MPIRTKSLIIFKNNCRHEVVRDYVKKEQLGQLLRFVKCSEKWLDVYNLKELAKCELAWQNVVNKKEFSNCRIYNKDNHTLLIFKIDVTGI